MMIKRWLTLGAVGLMSIQLMGCVAAVAGGAVATGALLHDRRTTGTLVDDHSLELKASQLIRELPDYEDLHVTVLSYNNNLLMVGQAPSDDARNAVENSMRRMEKVRRIYNEIAVGEPTLMARRSEDAWITTKVKSNLMFNDRIDGSRIKVLTENGIVYLIGIVTQEEEEQAVDVARHVRGVKKVVKLFEYTP